MMTSWLRPLVVVSPHRLTKHYDDICKNSECVSSHLETQTLNFFRGSMPLQPLAHERWHICPLAPSLENSLRNPCSLVRYTRPFLFRFDCWLVSLPADVMAFMRSVQESSRPSTADSSSTSGDTSRPTTAGDEDSGKEDKDKDEAMSLD